MCNCVTVGSKSVVSSKFFHFLLPYLIFSPHMCNQYFDISLVRAKFKRGSKLQQKRGRETYRIIEAYVQQCVKIYMGDDDATPESRINSGDH